MIELTRTTGQKLLFEGRHDKSVPAAMQSLKFSIELYGLSSIELVPSYLILGEASIGMIWFHNISWWLRDCNRCNILQVSGESFKRKNTFHKHNGLSSKLSTVLILWNLVCIETSACCTLRNSSTTKRCETWRTTWEKNYKCIWFCWSIK